MRLNFLKLKDGAQFYIKKKKKKVNYIDQKRHLHMIEKKQQQ